MMSITLPWNEALQNRQQNRALARFPVRSDREYKVPSHSPRFIIRRWTKLFTMGSCFARNIEEKLSDFDLPTMRFSVPKSEWPARPNGILNEFNPGTMAQRIDFALNGRDYPQDTIVEGRRGGYCDLSLAGGADVTLERAIERRAQIASMYSELPTCRTLIVTLGLVETWYDTKHSLFLNQMPPPAVLKRHGDRFVFRRLTLQESFDLLNRAIAALIRHDVNVLLTVSPVPLSLTFMGTSAVLANEYSKSVLRACAQALYEEHASLDYFPSYEMIRMRGPEAYCEDGIHVQDEVVGQITEEMLQRYIETDAEEGPTILGLSSLA